MKARKVHTLTAIRIIITTPRMSNGMVTTKRKRMSGNTTESSESNKSSRLALPETGWYAVEPG